MSGKSRVAGRGLALLLAFLLLMGCASPARETSPGAENRDLAPVEGELTPPAYPRSRGFPAVVPLPGGDIQIPDGGDLPDSVLVIWTSSTPRAVFDYMNAQLEEGGWEILQTVEAGDENFSLDALLIDEELYVFITEVSEDVTEVVLMTGPSG